MLTAATLLFDILAFLFAGTRRGFPLRHLLFGSVSMREEHENKHTHNRGGLTSSETPKPKRREVYRFKVHFLC